MTKKWKCGKCHADMPTKGKLQAVGDRRMYLGACCFVGPKRPDRPHRRADGIRFDGPGFMAAVDAAAREFGLKTSEAIARDSGISWTNLSTIRRGVYEPKAGAVAVLGAIYGVDPCRFAILKDGSRG